MNIRLLISRTQEIWCNEIGDWISQKSVRTHLEHNVNL